MTPHDATIARLREGVKATTDDRVRVLSTLSNLEEQIASYEERLVILDARIAEDMAAIEALGGTR